MAAWSAFRARLHGLLRRDVVSDEIREELDFHMRMRAEEYERRGDTREAAVRRARERVGNLAVVRDRGYDIRGGGVMETIIQDVRYGLRLLWKDRGFSAVAVLTLALGIGMSTALASVLNAALLNPMPYPHPEQLMHVLIEEPGDGQSRRIGPSVEDARALATSSHTTTGFAVSRGILTAPITDAEVPERLTGMEISEGFLPLYGVSPVIGRNITADDMRESADPVLLIGYDYWQHAYGGRADVLGKIMRFDDGVFTIVGVLPKTFHRATPIWRPLRLTPFVFTKRGLGTDVEARLAPGATVDMAQRELTNIMSRGADWTPSLRIQLSSLLDAEVRQSLTTSRVLTGAVGLILLIACVNVAGLLLARGSTRVSELAVRTAIGAGRGRLVRQLLTESLVLAVVGGIAGVLVAWWSLDAIVANLPLSLPSDASPAIDGRVLAFTASLTIVTGLVFGLVPALRLSRVRISNALARGSRRSGSPLSRRGGQVLIAIETMLAIVLLAGAGLMLRSFNRILSVNLGFRPDAFVTLEATPVTKDPAAFAAYYRSLVDRVRLIPGVSAAGAIDHLPLRGSSRFGSVTSSALKTGPASFANTRRVMPGYFEAMGFTPVAGRFPTPADLDGGRRVAVLNQTEAKALFPGAPPAAAIGQSITVGKEETEVIGVVSDIEFWGVPLSPTPRGMSNAEAFTLYRPVADNANWLIVVARPSGRVPALADQLREAARQAGTRALVTRVRTGSDWLDAQIITPKRRTVLLTLLGGLGLVLTLVGIVGMTAYAVARRTQEIGVRMAFGARTTQVVGMMLGDVARPVGVGLVLGIGAAVLTTQAIKSFLFETTPTDVPTFVGVAVTLALFAGLAAIVPARRAARVDPVSALRAD